MAATARARSGGGKRPPLADITNRKPAHPTPAPASSGSSIASSAPYIPSRCAFVVAEVRNKDRATMELEDFDHQLKKIKRISKTQVKNGDKLPHASSPPSNKIRKSTTNQQQHREPLDHDFAESIPSLNFIEKQRAYFAEIDAFELVEEFVLECDLE